MWWGSSASGERGGGGGGGEGRMPLVGATGNKTQIVLVLKVGFHEVWNVERGTR